MAYGALAVLMALITPLLEKSPTKPPTTPPFVFWMSRVIVLAFAGAMLRQLCHPVIGGWLDAMFSIAIVLALPLLGAHSGDPVTIPKPQRPAHASKV